MPLESSPLVFLWTRLRLHLPVNNCDFYESVKINNSRKSGIRNIQESESFGETNTQPIDLVIPQLARDTVGAHEHK